MKKLDYFEMTNLVNAYYKNEHINPKNGVEVGIIIEDMLNNFSNNNMEMCVQYLTSDKCHKTLQQKFFKMVLLSIIEFANKENYDDRNKASVNIAKEIVRLMEENGIQMNVPCI